MNILGVSAFYHDSAAALIVDGKIVAAAQEERFTRKKHDAEFPANAIEYCLKEAGIRSTDLDIVAFYDKPLLKFERLLETYYAFAPKGFVSFHRAIPIWIKEKLFLKDNLKKGLRNIHGFDTKRTKLLFPEHHLSHAASAFFPSPYERAAILTIDGVGEWATASICLGEGNDISLLKELRFPHSLGLLYSAFTYFLGFEVNGGEYKLMGLAPYGNENSEEVARFEQVIREKLIRIADDGSIFLNQKHFTYATSLRMVPDGQWEKLFGMKKRKPSDELTAQHCNLGLAIQRVTEEVVLKMAKTAKEITGAEYLCMAGGVALNCVANGKVEESGLFKGVFVQPAAGDAGGSLGAALAAWHIHSQKPRTPQSPDAMQGCYLGPSFSDEEIEQMAKANKAVFKKAESLESLTREIAGFLAGGKVVGWFQGRMEFGPRALGNRSILGDPRNPEMQKTLNLKIKFREGFRPFAPSVLASHQKDYFDMEHESPYMLMVHPVTASKRLPQPADYATRDVFQKLYHLRSDVPAITHVDYSARIQSVTMERSPRYWQLIDSFRQLTGCPMVVNTSFNVKDEPIVCSPQDAYACLMKTGMDVLVAGDYIFLKEEQPAWNG